MCPGLNARSVGLLTCAWLALSSSANAQLATNQQTFNATIQGDCSFVGLNNSYQFTYNQHGLQRAAIFKVTANTDISLAVQFDHVSSPQGATAKEYFRLYETSTKTMTTTFNRGGTSAALPITLDGGESQIYLYGYAMKNWGNETFNLLPGNYQYLVTVTCLQQ